MSDKLLYLDCSSGISGDMTVAALLDLGADQQVLKQALDSLPLSGYRIEIKDIIKSGLRACDFHVILTQENYDHDMNYLHGSQSQNAHTHETNSLKAHTHEAHLHETNSLKAHTHEAHLHETHSDEVHGDNMHLRDVNTLDVHSHSARNLADIISIIHQGTLTDTAKELSVHIFEIIARAEAAVHGKPVNEVHFHEVGAVDSIVDIVAAAVCIDNLHPDRIIISPLTDGYGQIRCQHGLIPIPVPAVAAIAEQNGLILKSSNIEGELVTPTGAAIAAALSSGFRLPTEYRILRTGTGAGKRNYACAGILRAMLLEEAACEETDTILSLETNIDDCTGEALSYTMHLLMQEGALDVFYTPIYMKKNRPAWLLRVLCREADRKNMERIIFRNTTTIGIRCQKLQRTRLNRNVTELETPWGIAKIKRCQYGSETYFYPENDSIAALASDTDTGFPEMYQKIQSYAREHC